MFYFINIIKYNLVEIEMDIDMIIEKHLMNEGKKPSISFYTGEYERSHGKKPGGRGG